MSAVVFWVVFGMLGVWIQFFAPGLDALAPGLVVSLQREHWSRTFWLLLAWILVQEGVGSMAFGGVIMIYGLLVGGFILGCRLFDEANPLFMLLLGLGYSLLLIVGQYILAGLQDVLLPSRQLLHVFLAQSFYFVAAWFIAHRLYGRKVVRRVRSL